MITENWELTILKEQEEIFDDIDIEEVDDAQTEDGQLYEHFRIVADAGQEKLRIDKFLFEHMQHSSRNRIQAGAEAGYIHVNEKQVKSR